MSLSEQIKTARKNAGLTQQQLAELIGVAKSTIAGYEKGDREPDAVKLKLIAKHTGVTGGYLLEIDESMPVLLDRNHYCESSRTIASSMLPQGGISKTARDIALLFDKLDEHGQEIVMAVAKIEFDRIDLDSISNGIDTTGIIGVQPIGNIRMHKVPLVGTAFCDGSGEMRYAAKEELREMEAETSAQENKV